MSKRIEDKMGLEFEPYSFVVEKGKVKEFALAIGDPNPAYQTGDAIPPTFPTVIDMWGGTDFFKIIERLELDIAKVLHGEQEYEYLEKIHIGDEITGYGKVVDVYAKAGMHFFKIETKYVNQHGRTVLIGRSTVIERH